MNVLFGDATTAMPTPATQAERGSLMSYGSPASLDIRRGGSPQPGVFSANDAIPGLDIDPPDIETGPDGKPIYGSSARGRSESTQEGAGGWITRMLSRTRNERSGSRGQYGRVGQYDD